MKNFTIAFAFLSLSSLTYAAPSTPHIKAREFEAAIFFTGTGPDPATYFQLFPTDDTVYPISKPSNTLTVIKASPEYCAPVLVESRATYLIICFMNVSHANELHR